MAPRTCGEEPAKSTDTDEPFTEIAALATECLKHLAAAPHVVVRVNDSLHEIARARLDEIARARGFEGRLMVVAEPEIAVGDCKIEWADGGVVRNAAKTDLAIVRFYPVLADRGVVPPLDWMSPDRDFGRRTYAARAAYEWVQHSTPSAAAISPSVGRCCAWSATAARPRW